MAERIDGARYVELPGEDHLPFLGDQDEILDEIEEFLTGVRRGPEPDRVLATVLSPTWSARPRRPQQSAIVAGVRSSRLITLPFAGSSSVPRP
jgi:hypothetical protein